MAEGRRADPHHRHGRRHDPGEAACLREAPGRRRARRPRLRARLRARQDPEGARHGGRAGRASRCSRCPYPVPFIAITEAIFTRLARRAVRHPAARGRRRARAHPRGDGRAGRRGHRGVARRRDRRGGRCCSTCTGCRSPPPGAPRASRAERVWDELRDSRPEGTSLQRSRSSTEGTTSGCSRWARRVASRRSSRSASPSSRASSTGSSPGTRSRLFAIELAKSRAVADAAAPAPGRLLRRARRGGSLSAADAARGLARFGFARDAQRRGRRARGRATSDRRSPDAVDGRPLAGRGRVPRLARTTTASTCCCPPTPDRTSASCATADRRAARRPSSARGAARRCPRTRSAGRLREARYALQVCRLEGWTQAGFEDLGTYRLLLSMADPDALRAFADSMLGPLDAYDRDHDGELLIVAPGVPRSTTRGGRRPRRSSSCTGTRSATGCARSRSSPGAICRAASTGWSSGSRCGRATCRRPRSEG